MTRLSKRISLLFLLLATCLPAGADDPYREFDPSAIAKTETSLWRCYYNGSHFSMGMQLVTMLQGQFGLSQETAMLAGAELAQGTVIFYGTNDNYYKTVLPHLERAYTTVKKELKADWDPKEAARAELDWWVARRTPGKNSPENVGKEIAKLYAILYGETNEDIEKAGLLRAKAAALRDEGGKKADWKEVGKLLMESYATLLKGVTPTEEEAAANNEDKTGNKGS